MVRLAFFIAEQSRGYTVKCGNESQWFVSLSELQVFVSQKISEMFKE